MSTDRKCNKSGCTGDCSSCKSAEGHQGAPQKEPCNQHSRIKKVIAVMSGKGGVGKSMVTASLAVLLNRKGYNVGILDGDITGPSIPKMFGVNKRAMMCDKGILPAITANGIKIMSVNLLLENPEAPVAWRGPVIGGAIKQFWTDVYWEELDYLLIDMPPGTGDVPLTVFQSIAVDAAITVTTPQELVGLIVKKAFNLTQMMGVSPLGIIENMSYALCPDCGKHIEVFGKSRLSGVCDELGVLSLGKMPILPRLAELADSGEFERNIEITDYLQGAADLIESSLSVK